MTHNQGADTPMTDKPIWPPPMPSAKDEWMAKYVARMVEQGVGPEDAWACCRSGEDSHDYSSDPRDAADDEMSYWDNDEDGVLA